MPDLVNETLNRLASESGSEEKDTAPEDFVGPEGAPKDNPILSDELTVDDEVTVEVEQPSAPPSEGDAVQDNVAFCNLVSRVGMKKARQIMYGDASEDTEEK